MGSQPSPPTLDTAASGKLTEKDYQLKLEYSPLLSEEVGKAGREEYARNVAFALQGFTNPNAIVYGGQIEDLNERRKNIESQIDELKGGNLNSEEQQRLSGLREQLTSIDNRITDLRDRNPVEQLTNAFRDQFAQADALQKQMQRQTDPTEAYTRMQSALRRGVDTQQADLERMRAFGTDRSGLGRSLMDEAMDKVRQGGRLSPEASRDAVQAARSGMAARGLATSGAGMAAELLNRDRYSRAREFENLGFAQNVEQADLARRMQNTQNRQAAAAQNAQAFNQQSQFNTLQRSDTDRFNLGLLQTSAQAADNERVRKLALGQSAYNFALQTDPKMMLAGLGSPYANFTPQALGLMSNQNVQPIYSGGSPGTAGQNMMLAGTLGGGALAAGGTIAGAAILV